MLTALGDLLQRVGTCFPAPPNVRAEAGGSRHSSSRREEVTATPWQSRREGALRLGLLPMGLWPGEPGLDRDREEEAEEPSVVSLTQSPVPGAEK